jgi:2-desacetyl-2-hydroxyethyl bacteriochlorophyllide A dehydrogenase
VKAIVVEKPNRVVYKEVDIPTLSSGEVLIKLKYTAICATDFGVIEGRVPKARYPIIPGHEWSGIVEEVYDKRDEYLLGKRVVAENHITCMRCPACRQGKWNQCVNYDEIGFSKNGGYAEYLKTIANNIHLLPDEISDIEASLIEPTAVAVYTMLRTGVQIGDNVTILGDGPIGLLCMQIAKNMGGQKILVSGGHDSRLKLARKFGAYETFNRHTDPISIVERVREIHEGGSDVVIEAAGSPKAFRDALDIAHQEAIIGITGFCEWKEAIIQPDKILTKNLTVRGADASPGTWDIAIRLVANGKINLRELISHTFQLEECEKALMIVKNKEDDLVKGVFKIN